VRQRQEVQELPRSRRLRRHHAILAAVAFANFIVAALHFGLAASGPILRDELELDTSQLGLLLATPAIGLMLGTFLWGELSDRLRERHVLTIAFAGFAMSAAGAALLLDASVVAFGVAVLLSGAFGSAAHSAGGRAISASFPPERHGLVLSIRHTAIPIGGAVGGLVVPLIARESGIGRAVAIMAVLGAIACVGVWLTVPSDVALATGSAEPYPVGRSPLREPAMWLLCIGGGSMAFVQLGIGAFLTTQLVGAAGRDLSVAVAIFTAVQVIGAGGRIVLGIWSDRRGDRVGVLRGLALAAALLLAPTLLGVSSLADGVLYALAVIAVTSSNGVSVATAASFAPAGRTGATLGMQTTWNAAAGAIAPILLGAVLEWAGWRGFEACVLAVLLVGLASLSILARRTRAIRALG
jgi:sugar phosphate permease